MRLILFTVLMSLSLNTWAEHGQQKRCGGSPLKEMRGIYTDGKGQDIKVCVLEVSCTEFQTDYDDNGSNTTVTGSADSIRKIACAPDDDNQCPLTQECAQDDTVPSDDVDDIKIIKRKSHKDSAEASIKEINRSKDHAVRGTN